MSDETTPRYGFAPQVPFAATLAFAGRPARETATAASPDDRPSRPSRSLLRRLAGGARQATTRTTAAN